MCVDCSFPLPDYYGSVSQADDAYSQQPFTHACVLAAYLRLTVLSLNFSVWHAASESKP